MTDYHTALTSAAWFDRSDTGKVELTGPDAPSFVSNLSTNNIKSLPLGGGCRTLFCTATAKTLFDTNVFHVRLDGGRNALWLETTPGRGELLLKHLDRHLISEAVELADRTASFAQFHVAGPEARERLGRAVGEPIPDLKPYQHMERTIGTDAVASIRRLDPLGVPGFDIVVSANRAPNVRDALAGAGVVAGTPEAFEVLRVEAGTPVYGIDIDETRFVMEVGGAADAVYYEKGCFVGQEPIVMARDRTGFIARAFLGLRAADAGGPLERGAKLFAGDAEVGVVTSSVQAPGASAAVAMGYVKRGFQEPGQVLEARGPGKTRAVSVATLPLRG